VQHAAKEGGREGRAGVDWGADPPDTSLSNPASFHRSSPFPSPAAPRPTRAEPADAARAEALAAAGISVDTHPAPTPAPSTSAAAAAPLSPTLSLRLAAAARPHPAKAATGGEDAFFVVDSGEDATAASAPGALGVADGVGGWAESGVDPGAYARALMTLARAALAITTCPGAPPLPPSVTAAIVSGAPPNTAAAGGGAPPLAEAGWGAGARRLRGRRAAAPFPPGLPLAAAPRAALAAAHARVRLPGSCTALVAVLDPATATLHGVNLGDSGLAVFRAGGGPAPIFKTSPSQHYFDCPFQLASGGAGESDTAADADAFAVPLERGDVVVAGTDGLWDNAWAEEVGAALPAAGPLPAGAGPAADAWVAAAAGRLVALAAANAQDPAYPGPYAAEAAAAAAAGADEEKGAREAGGGAGGFLKGLFFGREDEEGEAAAAVAAAASSVPAMGGKLDDVTVVVGVVL